MTPSLWAKYERAVNAYSDTVSLQTVLWKRMVARIDRWQEGIKQFEDITFKTLVAYNTFRTWPVDSRTDTGIIDKEYMHLYLNKAQMEREGHLTPEGQLNFNPGYDRFWINGLEYEPAGDTGTGQAEDNPLYIILILEREVTPTGVDSRT